MYVSKWQQVEVIYVLTHRYTVTVTWDMHKRLEEERERRYLDSIPATIRMILSEYLSRSNQVTSQDKQ